MAIKYISMIESALITLSDRKGSTRQAIWKFIHSQYPEADYKQFLIRLKKDSLPTGCLLKDQQRYKLTLQRRNQMLKGVSIKKKKSEATMKKERKHGKESAKHTARKDRKQKKASV
jgi:hypothetical protein